MLAHLHQLQSENRRMQTRIMELASQREFYIATNTRLHQTLTENQSNRLPNGVQPLGDSILQNTTSDNQSTPDPRDSNSIMSSSLPKSAQDSLLQAHFLATSLPPGFQPSRSSAAEKKSGTSPSLASHGHNSPQPMFQAPNTMQFPSAHSLFSVNPQSSSLGDHDGERTPGSGHEVTHVTNSIQAPITTFTPLPGMNANPSISPHRQSGFYKTRNFSSSNPSDKT